MDSWKYSKKNPKRAVNAGKERSRDGGKEIVASGNKFLKFSLG
jgi:hypothetical protein